MRCLGLSLKPAYRQRRPIWWPLVGHQTTSEVRQSVQRPSGQSPASGDSFDGRREVLELTTDDVVVDPQGKLAVIVPQEAWNVHYGNSDGLGPENWPDRNWTGVWYPGENGLVGQFGDLDRVGTDTDYYKKHPDSEAIKALLHGLVTAAERLQVNYRRET